MKRLKTMDNDWHFGPILTSYVKTGFKIIQLNMLCFSLKMTA